MVRHLVAFTLKDDLTPEQKRESAAKIKVLVEGLKKTVPGVIESTVYIDFLPTSNVDVLLDTVLESAEALAAYQVHPDHLPVGEFVKSVRKDRMCADYIV